VELAIETKESGAVSVERLRLAGRIVLGRASESPVGVMITLTAEHQFAFFNFAS
jgi:hypothetical protein